MIYIHVPFCRSFCTYCDFYSELACKGRDNAAIERYLNCILREIDNRRDEIESTLGTNTLYIGGGTPSVLPLSALGKIVSALGYGPYEEFTIEVNPEDLLEKGPEYIEGLVKLGVNRISMGIQSLDDGILHWMNRRHNAAGAIEALEMAGKMVKSVSVDIITGVPGMSLSTIKNTLENLLERHPSHISAYQLSIEEGSALAKMIEEGKVRESSEEECREQYDYLCQRLAEAGYHHYEISNWALPGFEAVHNSAYWTRQPYVGLGPAAHSLRFMGDGTQRRSWNSQKPYDWTSEFEVLTPEEIREEQIMLLNRTDKGTIPEKDWFISDEIIAGMI